jgi:hypothetical protein
MRAEVPKEFLLTGAAGQWFDGPDVLKFCFDRNLSAERPIGSRFMPALSEVARRPAKR